MVPLWGVNVTQNKKNETANGRELIVATVSQKIDIEEVQDRAEELERKAALPKPWGLIKWVCGFIALVMAGGILKGVAKVGFEQAVQNAPILLAVFVVCTVTFVVLKIWGNRRSNAVMKSDEVEQFDVEVKQTLSVAYGELGVPEDAVKMDAFVFRYKEKNGKISVRSMGFFDFINVEVRAYVKDGALCFADTESVWIPSASGYCETTARMSPSSSTEGASPKIEFFASSSTRMPATRMSAATPTPTYASASKSVRR